jgi:hypothetical protein
LPLRASINGEMILAPFLDDIEWNRLTQRVKSENLEVTIPCCGNPAYLRTSKHGIHHFVHKVRSDCTSAPETWQHLKAKQAIVRACRDAGYDAITEVGGDGWRADVLAVKGNVKIAFEVQWSSQTWDVTQERQQRYKDAGIRCCWLFKSPPEGYRASRDVPLFKLNIFEDACIVVFNPQSYYDWQEEEHQTIELSNFVKSLLTGKIRFCEYITAKPQKNIEIQFINHPCWKCGALYHVYRVMTTFESNCGQSLLYHMYMYNPDSDLNLAFHPEIQQAVGQHISERKGYELAKFTKYYRKEATVGLDAFQCPHCDALLGHKYLMETYNSDKSNTSDIISIPIQFKNPPMILEEDEDFGSLQGHWCFPENGKFCC